MAIQKTDAIVLHTRDFTETSLLPMAARGANIEFPELCSEIVRMAMARSPERVRQRVPA